MATADALSLAARVLHDPEPAPGSDGGHTFTGTWFREPAYVRLYLDDAGRAPVDLGVLARLEGRLPLARVLAAVPRADPGSLVPAHVVTAAVPGVRGDALLRSTSGDAAAALGRQCARVLSVLRQHRLDAPGRLLDRSLTTAPWPPERATATAAAHDLADSLTAAGLDVGERSPLSVALAAADTRLATVEEPSTLLHGGLGPDALVVDADTGRLRAVLGWGAACSGDWLTDAGSLLRGLEPAAGVQTDVATDALVTSSGRAFRDTLVDAVHTLLLDEQGGSAARAQDWQARARDRDLVPLLELAARTPGPSARPAAREAVLQARRLLAELTGGR
ncbi:MAG TPA: phosphotransferase [Actinomycetales bacterium]